MRALLDRFSWAKTVLARDAAVLLIAAGDPRTPWTARLVSGFTAAYVLSPIDLVPDFIPVLGALDDLVVAAAGVFVTFALLPDTLLHEFRQTAAQHSGRANRIAGDILAVAFWSLVLVCAAYWLYPLAPSI